MTRSIALMLLLLSAGLLFALAPGDTVAVSVREGELRSSAGFLSGILERLDYGTTVTIVSARGDWAEVTTVQSGLRGWLHVSAVAPPAELNLTGQTTGGTATTQEIALAGRGFSEQVEREYRDENDLNFAGVDLMEGYLQPPETLGAFLQAINADLDEGDS